MEFTLRIPEYNKVEHLHGTMVEFGKYAFAYVPPEGSDEPAWEMTISAEATRPQLIAFYEKFLLVAGYLPPDYTFSEQYWKDKFFDLLEAED
jgi:hypothetical protein